MRIKNDHLHYGALTISLHWLIALLIIGMLSLGLYMVDLPIGVQKIKFYGWHKAFGTLVLALGIIRLLWRINNITPELNIPRWERLAARTMHWALYGFMLIMPITGWLMSSAAGFPVSFFGLFTLPDLIAPNEELRNFFGLAHEYLAYLLIAAIVIHIAAALKHHFIDKDDILRRMI